ncbi:MAG: response regulator [Candidatus Aenigmatarchaeota archaeon]
MQKKEILVVDDEETVLEYLRTVLEIEGYVITTASTATEALGKIKSKHDRFPVVLVDIVMPGIDGIELLKIIKRDYPDIIVIMLTGQISLDLARKSLDEGAFAYLTKPINIDELKSVLRNAFEKYTLTQEIKILKEKLEKTEVSHRLVTQNIVTVVIATDMEGKIKRINKAMGELLGYKEEELVGRPIDDIFAEEFKHEFFNKLVKENRLKDFPIKFRDKNGQKIELFFSGTVMKDVKGNIIGFLGMVQKKQYEL